MPVARVAVHLEGAVDGRWVDDGGSRLELSVGSDGRVSGILRPAADVPTYRSYPVAGTYVARARGDRGIVGSVTGWPCQGSITIWCGEYEASTDQLTVSWLVPHEAGATPARGGPTGGVLFTRPAPTGAVARRLLKFAKASAQVRSGEI